MPEEQEIIQNLEQELHSCKHELADMQTREILLSRELLAYLITERNALRNAMVAEE